MKSAMRWFCMVLAVAALACLSPSVVLADHTGEDTYDSPGNGGSGCGKDGEPILLQNGAYTESAVDFHLPGVGVDFVVERTYVSNSATDGSFQPLFQTQFGVGWRSNLDRRLRFIEYEAGTNKEILAVVYTADREARFKQGSTAGGYTTYDPQDGASRDRLRKNTSTGRFELDTGNLVYTFYNTQDATRAGRLYSVKDKVGTGRGLEFSYPTTGEQKYLFSSVTETVSGPRHAAH